MIRILDPAITKARTLPEEDQDALGAVLFRFQGCYPRRHRAGQNAASSCPARKCRRWGNASAFKLLEFSILGVMKKRHDRKHVGCLVDLVKRDERSARNYGFVDISSSTMTPMRGNDARVSRRNRRTRLKVRSATGLPNFSTPYAK
jgi:hypothetical protein